jgi:hypothetical protein
VGYTLYAGAKIQLSGLIGAVGPTSGDVIISSGSFLPPSANWSLADGGLVFVTQRDIPRGEVSKKRSISEVSSSQVSEVSL